MYIVTGSNIFGQWFSNNTILTSFQIIEDKNINLNKAKLIHITWSYNIFEMNDEFYISGAWKGRQNQFIKVPLPRDCKNSEHFILTGNDYRLQLVDLKNHSVWVIDFEKENDVKKINFNTESPLPLTESPMKKICKENIIIKVCSRNVSCLYLTAEGVVYYGMLPSYLDTSHCIGKIIDIECGYEHNVLLTDEGRVYTWGNGRRLALGHGDLINLETPKEVEALAGIKIIKIRTGGWHTLALSEFGDLYVWGWNEAGQLGVNEKSKKEETEKDLKIEDIQSYGLPTLVDIFNDEGEIIEINIKDIACGTKHSVILLEDNTLWLTGFNKYGQLGISPELYPKVNCFKKVLQCENNCMIMCGPWSTVIINKC